MGWDGREPRSISDGDNLSDNQTELGIGLLGYGATGRRHARAWRAMPFLTDAPKVRLTAVADPDSEAADDAVEEAGFEWIAESPDELIGHPAIQAVDICTPATEHAMAIRSAMAAGKHICCVAPLAYTLREAEEISGLAGRTEGVKFLATTYRHLPPLVLARELVDAGFVGEARRFHIHCLKSFALGAENGAQLPLDDTLSTGVLPDILDLVRALAGDITEVHASFTAFSTDGAGPGAEGESVRALMRFASGGEGILDACAATNGMSNALEVELVGSEGAIRFSLDTPNTLQIFDATAEPSVRGWKALAAAPLEGGAETSALREFARAARTGEPVSPNFRDGLILHRISEAMRQSADAGCWTPVDLGR
jgi:predicted dehydrogenase